MLNKVLLLGYLATLPEVKQENGIRYVEFEIAQRIKKNGKNQTYFHTVRSPSPKVESLLIKANKGDLLYVNGVLVVERGGKKAKSPISNVYILAGEVRIAYKNLATSQQNTNQSLANNSDKTSSS